MALEVEKAALKRLQFFSLMFRAYDGLRKAVSHVRWDHGDAESWASSLYSGRGAGRPKKAAAEQVAPAPAPAPAASAPPAATAPPKPSVGGGFADDDPLNKP